MRSAAAHSVGTVKHQLLVFYGSYRSNRQGIRLASYIVEGLRARGNDTELIDARAVGLPMLERMLKEYEPGTAPAALAELGAGIRRADGFVEAAKAQRARQAPPY